MTVCNSSSVHGEIDLQHWGSVVCGRSERNMLHHFFHLHLPARWWRPVRSRYIWNNHREMEWVSSPFSCYSLWFPDRFGLFLEYQCHPLKMPTRYLPKRILERVSWPPWKEPVIRKHLYVHPCVDIAKSKSKQKKFHTVSVYRVVAINWTKWWLRRKLRGVCRWLARNRKLFGIMLRSIYLGSLISELGMTSSLT